MGHFTLVTASPASQRRTIYDCFEYDQQAMLSLADTNLENPVTSESGRPTHSGYVNHQRRNSAGVFDISEKWRV